MSTLKTCRSRFTRPVFIWSVGALATEIAVNWVPDHLLHRPAPRSLALLPLIPAMLFMVALVRAIQKMDELQKRICLESVFIAFVLTLILTFVFAGLERMGIPRVPWDDIGSWMMLLWAFAYVVSSWRYR